MMTSRPSPHPRSATSTRSTSSASPTPTPRLARDLRVRKPGRDRETRSKHPTRWMKSPRIPPPRIPSRRARRTRRTMRTRHRPPARSPGWYPKASRTGSSPSPPTLRLGTSTASTKPPTRHRATSSSKTP